MRVILGCAAVTVLSIPLIARAQGSAPPAAAKPMPAPAAAALKSPAATSYLRTEVDRQLKAMADSLKLTSQQRTSLRPILVDHANQLRQLHDKYAPVTPANREAMMKEVQTLRDATDSKMAGVLSADQMAQFKKMRDEQLAKMRAKAATMAPKPQEKK